MATSELVPVRCVQCQHVHTTKKRALGRKREREDSPSELTPYICETCRLGDVHDGVERRNTCDNCHRVKPRLVTAFRVAPFLEHQVERVCLICYALGNRNMRANKRFWPVETPNGASVSNAAGPAKQAGNADPSIRATSEPSAHAISVALEKRLLTLVANPFSRNPVLWPEQYRQHVNSVADGLFDIFFRMEPDGRHYRNALIRTLVQIEQMAHNICGRHSHVMMEISVMLYLSGMTYRGLKICARVGFGKDPSQLREDFRRGIAEHQKSIRLRFREKDRQFMVLVDDKNGNWTGPLPTKKNSNSTEATVANVGLKEITACRMPLGIEEVNFDLFPDDFSGISIGEFVRGRWTAIHRTSYMGQRSETLRAAAAVAVPYGYQHGITGVEGVNLKTYNHYNSFDCGYKTTEQICIVFNRVAHDFNEYMLHHHMPVVGDWYTFWNAVCIRRSNPALYGRLLPLPGPFHIGLNAQTGIFFIYRPIISKLWAATFSGKPLPVMKRPLERKYAMDLLCRGWETVRKECLEMAFGARHWTLETIALLRMLEEHVPLATDIYASFLTEDMNAYLRSLVRAMEMFMQTGKVHYTKICAVFLALMSHWKAHDPDLFARFSDSLRCTSEEEIELFHSTIAHYIDRRITATRLAERINVHAACRGSLGAWETATSVKRYAGGKCVEHYPEAVTEMGRAIKGLFEQAINSSAPCTPDMDKHEWKSSVFGTFSDCMLPIPLQQNPEAIGLSGINLRQWKVSMGSGLTTRRHFECGHLRHREAICSQCLHITTHIAHEALVRFERDIDRKKPQILAIAQRLHMV